MDKDLIEYGGKTENFDPRIVIFEGSPRPSLVPMLCVVSKTELCILVPCSAELGNNILVIFRL